MSYNSETNEENVFLKLLSTEQDILYKIISELETETIVSLGHTCKKCKRIFIQFGVWKRILSEWKMNIGLGNGYDFSKRMETNDDDLILQRLKLMKERYRIGPSKVSTASVSNFVISLAVDDSNIAVLLKNSWLLLFERKNMKTPKLKIDTEGLISNKIFTSESYILVCSTSASCLRILSKTTGNFVGEINIHNSINIERTFSGVGDILAVEFKTNAPMNSMNVYKISDDLITFLYQKQMVTANSCSISLCKTKLLFIQGKDMISMNLEDGSMLHKLTGIIKTI